MHYPTSGYIVKGNEIIVSKRDLYSHVQCSIIHSSLVIETTIFQQVNGIKPSDVTYVLLLLLSHFSHVRPCATHRLQPTRLPCPWDYPGKDTGVGCHFLPQCMKVKRESEVAQSCLTLSDPMDCSLPGSSVRGIFQARVLESGAIAFSE